MVSNKVYGKNSYNKKKKRITKFKPPYRSVLLTLYGHKIAHLFKKVALT